MTRRRISKIACLPKNLRDEVNLMLRDGARYSGIISRLAQAGVSVSNTQVSDWKLGGHEDWVREQRRLEELRAIREFCLKAVSENEDGAIPQAGLLIAATQLYEILTAFDLESLSEKLAGDPAQYARLVLVLAKIADGGLKFQRLRAQVEEQKAKIGKQIDDAKPGGLSEQGMAEIQKALKLL